MIIMYIDSSSTIFDTACRLQLSKMYCLYATRNGIDYIATRPLGSSRTTIKFDLPKAHPLADESGVHRLLLPDYFNHAGNEIWADIFVRIDHMSLQRSLLVTRRMYQHNHSLTDVATGRIYCTQSILDEGHLEDIYQYM